MIHRLAIAFLITFVGGHLADQHGDAIDRPLSLFRDVEPVWIGYAMFAFLIAIALEMSRTAWRIRNRTQTAVYLFAACSLYVTALTDSLSSLHYFAANVTLFVLFANYALLLDRADMPFWLTFHLSIPLALVVAVFLAPAATWEKALDLYFVGAVLIHHHAMQKSFPPAINTPTPAESDPTSSTI